MARPGNDAQCSEKNGMVEEHGRPLGFLPSKGDGGGETESA